MRFTMIIRKLIIIVVAFISTFSVYSNIVVGEIRGNFKNNDKYKRFHGYFVFIENLEKYFEPIATGYTDMFNKNNSGYLTTTAVWAQNTGAFLAINANFLDPEMEKL